MKQVHDPFQLHKSSLKLSHHFKTQTQVPINAGTTITRLVLLIVKLIILILQNAPI